MSKQFYFKQFSLVSMQFSSIWAINRTLSGATTPGQSRSGSDSNEWVLCIPQSSSITGASPSGCLVSYIQDTCCGSGLGLTPLQRCSQSILQPQPTGQWTELTNSKIHIYLLTLKHAEWVAVLASNFLPIWYLNRRAQKLVDYQLSRMTEKFVFLPKPSQRSYRPFRSEHPPWCKTFLCLYV